MVLNTAECSAKPSKPARKIATFLVNPAQRDTMWQIDRMQIRSFKETSHARDGQHGYPDLCEVVCLPCRLSRTFEVEELPAYLDYTFSPAAIQGLTAWSL